MKGSHGLLLEFWDPSISQERLNLETSNLACRLDTWRPKRNNAKLGQMGSTQGHVTYFLQFRDPSISLERLKQETSTLANRFATGGPNKNGKLGQNGS